MDKKPVLAIGFLFAMVWSAGSWAELRDESDLSLGELLALYQEVGLPLPHKGAKLLRYHETGTTTINGVVQSKEYYLAIKIKDGQKGEGPWVRHEWREYELTPQHEAQEVAPAPEVLQRTTNSGSLMLSLQCYALGWKPLANEMLSRTLDSATESPRQEILHQAWNYWTDQMMTSKVDRRPIPARLQRITKLDPDLSTPANRSLLRSLELSLVPSTAMPGSIEASIDALVDENVPQQRIGEESTLSPSASLARLGFEAVPTLLEHLDDARLTRATWQWFKGPPQRVLVRDVVAVLLENLAGHEEYRKWRKQVYAGSMRSSPLVKRDVQKWWINAQNEKEEAYLLGHLVNNYPSGEHLNLPNLKVLGQKYPRNLGTVYRTILAKPSLQSWPVVDVIVDSPLTNSEKTELLLVGASQKNLIHRVHALRMLQKFASKQFIELLCKALDDLPAKPKGSYWASPELALVKLATSTDDAEVWRQLQQATRKAEPKFRMEMLGIATREEAHFERRLQLLAAFFNDDSVRDITGDSETDRFFDCLSYLPKLEIRNGAALLAARLLKVDFEPDPMLKPDDQEKQFIAKLLSWKPEDWAKLRSKLKNKLADKGIAVSDR